MADKLRGQEPSLKLRLWLQIFCPPYSLAKHNYIMHRDLRDTCSFIGCFYCIFTSSEKSFSGDVLPSSSQCRCEIACAAFHGRSPRTAVTRSSNINRKMTCEQYLGVTSPVRHAGNKVWRVTCRLCFTISRWHFCVYFDATRRKTVRLKSTVNTKWRIAVSPRLMRLIE